MLRRGRKLVFTLAGVAMGIALLALLGHYAGVASLVSLRPGFRSMSGLSATCLILLATGLGAASLDRKWLSAGAAAAATVLAVAVIASYGLQGNDSVSPWWASHVLFLPTGPGRTSRSTAAAVIFIAAALLLQKRPRIADLSGAAALVLASVALLGYAYGVEDLYLIPFFNNIAPNTATALLLLAFAALFLTPTVGWSAIVGSSLEIGGATRRQLILCLLLPLIGWLVTAALKTQQIGAAAAMAIFVAAVIVPLAWLILRDGSRLLALEEARHARDEEHAAAAKAVQRQLAEQALLLKQEAAERTRAEEAMYRAQRLDAIGQLTGGIAHDFNNLLMVLSGNVQLLKRRMPADDPLRRYVDNMGVAVGKGSKVTQQLLAFSRSQRLDIKATQVQNVVVNGRKLIGSSLGPLIKVQLELEAPDDWALCDADQLELSLINLAVNARDAMLDGGTLTITCARSALTQGPAESGRAVLVTVVDSGVGMTEEVAAHAAEPFFTTKDQGKGTGLGLAQVYGFVHQCGGELRIVSAPGEGTAVEMRFPGVAAPASKVVPPAEREGIPEPITAVVRQLRVMVIDDDDGVRDVIVEALTEAGYDVVAAVDGESGLAEMQRFEPAVAIIDFLMPGMNGADVARAAQARYPRLPIIFVSGYSDTAALDGVSGASILRKPFEVATLARMVEVALYE